MSKGRIVVVCREIEGSWLILFYGFKEWQDRLGYPQMNFFFPPESYNE
jgi:hypothetical protein